MKWKQIPAGSKPASPLADGVPVEGRFAEHGPRGRGGSSTDPSSRPPARRAQLLALAGAAAGASPLLRAPRVIVPGAPCLLVHGRRSDGPAASLVTEAAGHAHQARPDLGVTCGTADRQHAGRELAPLVRGEQRAGASASAASAGRRARRQASIGSGRFMFANMTCTICTTNCSISYIYDDPTAGASSLPRSPPPEGTKAHWAPPSGADATTGCLKLPEARKASG